ncbi:unnamed protein product [Porites lobata]|uniref:G-protein coupled receptors family 1 profile domain-containing protein n=1 Tax=Porites lobata TaxID=104759 RepID=A0ABN8R1G5_9CNID|nr:unnamed protein product [Porites lobata]
MEIWFWILGWVLSFLAIIGNGFTIFLVCSRRNLRTKTNAFVVSLAVADFCVGLSVIPSLLACEFTNTCHWPDYWLSWVNIIRLLFSHSSVVNLCGLVLDRFIAIIYPLKYITLMTRRRITQVIFLSWALPVSYNALKNTLCIVLFQNDTSECPFIWPTIISEFLPCVVLMLCFVSMIFHVCRHDQSARTLAKQLRFNHQVSFKTHHEKSAVIMMGIVIGVFLVCYGMYLRCSFLILSSSPCNDENYKITFLVLNSAINPLAYAFFKRDIKKEFKRLVGAVRALCTLGSSPQTFPSWKDVVRWLFSYLFVLNLSSLVLDRYIAIVKPFKYVTFMTRSRVIEVITSCWIASFTLVAFKTALRLCCETPLTSIVAVVVLMISMEIVPCVLQIFCFVSMLLHVWKHDRSARTLAKQLRFNHGISFKTHKETSAVIMMGIVIGVFVVCYGIYLRCSLVVLSDTNASCKDEQYKIPVLVLNSAINPMSYAFFKRDIKKEFKRLISQLSPSELKVRNIMETWFWILGWVLSFLAIIGNGFTIFLVCSRRNLRTKTNAFVVSLAVADFCVGLSVIPSLLACEFTNTCHWPDYWLSWVNIIRLLFSHSSVVNLCGLVLDRFIAIIYPLKYITLMTRRRITQVIFLSWALPVSYNALKNTLCIVLFQNDTSDCPFIWPTIISEFLLCAVLMLCFVSMIFHVCRHDQSARTLAKQLRFNHQVSFKTHHEKSAVMMMGIVIGVFLVCYGMYLRCSFLILSSSPCNDENYKITFLVLNSAINPLAYAFFKRDIKKEFKRLVGAVFYRK